MEIVISVAAKIAEYTVAPVGRQLGYLFRYSANVDNLKIRMQDLNDARERLQHRVDEARNNCEEIEADVQNWLNNVDEISLEAETFLSHGDHAKAECSSCGSVLHLVTRHQFSRKAKKMSTEVCAVDKKKFDGIQISYRLHRQESYSAITKDYETFDSRKGILASITEAVRDADRSRIGLHGMPGIGKTMLANEIARQAVKDKLFSKVIIITISQKPNEEAIQQHIADMLELKFGETDNTKGKRATLLQQRLKQENKIMLILDDIWKELNLKEIGIHDECQMLLTSRTLHVLRNSMGIAESNVFFLQPLDPLEATSLFKKIIGEIVENAYYNPLARQIVAECAGLPVSIATLAHALKYNMVISTWQDALHRLRSSGFIAIEGMDEKVYSSIRLSYDFLGSHEKEAKSLLLLCALHKEDAEIGVEDLMRYRVGCRLLRGIYTVNETRNRVNSLVDKLKSHCLLLDGKSKSHVKMHDVIRDVCILIAKEDEHRMNNITSSTMYEEFVKDETNKTSKVISFLDYDDFKKLPRRLECPCLKLLLISSWSLESIPDDFFEQTRKLEALGINYARLQSLPPSFQFLINLQTLCLPGSSLEDIAVIGELKNLKVLDLSWSSSIELLPKEIGELRRLQLLDLQGCHQLSVIEPNVISNLTQMEELYLPEKFKGWEIEEGSMKERRNASLIEINSLQLLTILYLSVASEHILPEKLFSEKLERYQVSIGGEYNRYNEFSRWLQLNLSNMNEINASGLKSLIKMSEYLSLERLVDVTNVVHDLDKDGFPRLKCLRLIRLTSLERICHGKLPTASFKELRKVEVRNCGRLKNLFPLSVTKLLHEIRVEECEMMEEIVSHGRENEGDDEASHNIDESFQLRSLFLHSLPKFVHFYFSKLKTTGESSLVSLPNLKELVMKKLDVVILWPDQPLSSCDLQNLTSLKLERCNRIEYLFCFSMTERLVNLKNVKVHDCVAMKGILGGRKTGEERRSSKNNTLFAKLETLKLSALPVCKTFCSEQVSVGDDEGKIIPRPKYFFNGIIAFLNLKELTIRNCNNIKYLLSSAVALSLVQLKTLDVYRCENIEEVIVSDEESSGGGSKAIIFEKLESLKLMYLPNIIKFCGRDGIECPLLSELGIEDCPKLKEFISNSMGTRACTVSEEIGIVVASKQSLFNDKVSFANLEILEVGSCDNLKCMFSFTLAQCFVNLRSLKVGNCKAMEDICVTTKKFGEEESQLERILFPKLESIELDKLSALQRFCTTDSCMEFPLLSKLIIKDCRKEVNQLVPAEPFFNEKIAFSNLKEWRVWNCNNIKYLLSSTMARSLVQLETLEIWGCENIEEVIVSDEESGGGGSKAIIFEKLKSLQLEYLPNIIKFCGGDCIECPLLSTLKIWDCPKLKEFISNSMGRRTCTASEEMDIMVASKQSLFNDKIAFPNLKELTVSYCNNIKYLLSSVIARSLVQLKELSVKKCENIEEVIVSDEESSGGGSKAIIFEKLESLKLMYLPNIIKFCGGDGIECPLLSELGIEDCPKLKEFISNSIGTRACTVSEEIGIVVASKQSLFNDKIAFPNLKELIVSHCNNIKYLLSSSIARSLVQLKTLGVEDCENIEEVIVSDEESCGGRSKAIIFEKLESLELKHLPNVIKFCEGDGIECPLLSKLRIWNCPKVKEFISNSTGTRVCTVSEEMGMVAVSKQSLFKDKIAFPNLKELHVWNCDNIKYLLSSSMARSLVQLKTLEVYRCENIEEVIVSDEESGGGGSKAIIFEKLKSLELKNLPNVIKFCEGDGIACPLLSELGIEDCPKLKEFISNSMGTRTCTASEEMSIMVASKQSLFDDKIAFPNLKELCVCDCNNVKYLLSSVMTRSLVQLKKLDVFRCENIEEVIVSDEESGGGGSKAIIFEKLESLELSYLPNIIKICVGDVIECPLLSNLVIKNCPKVKEFISNSMSTRACTVSEEMGMGAPSFMSFYKLKTLTVEKCNGLTYLLSSSTAATLVQLKKMRIRNCRMMREVINTNYYNDEKGQLEGETEHHHFVFHTLKRLELYNLPSLQSFYSGNKDISFPNLTCLSLKKCPKIRRFSHGVINTSASLKTIMVDYEEVEIWEREFNTTARRLWKETDQLWKDNDDDDQLCDDDDDDDDPLCDDDDDI